LTVFVINPNRIGLASFTFQFQYLAKMQQTNSHFAAATRSSRKGFQPKGFEIFCE
jgi:hypothetical protein